MTAAEAETIIKYYADIAGQQRAIARERAALDAEYSPLRGNAAGRYAACCREWRQHRAKGAAHGGHGHGPAVV